MIGPRNNRPLRSVTHHQQTTVTLTMRERCGAPCQDALLRRRVSVVAPLMLHRSADTHRYAVVGPDSFIIFLFLYRLINALQPGSVRKINNPSQNWHQVTIRR